MRTSIVLDDDLVEHANELTGLDTERAVLHEALRVLIRLREQKGVRSLRGTSTWEGSLSELREGRFDTTG